jgi:hypothetical protein
VRGATAAIESRSRDWVHRLRLRLRQPSRQHDGCAETQRNGWDPGCGTSSACARPSRPGLLQCHATSLATRVPIVRTLDESTRWKRPVESAGYRKRDTLLPKPDAGGPKRPGMAADQGLSPVAARRQQRRSTYFFGRQ